MKYLLLLICLSCRGTDIQPDEFAVEVSHADSDFNNSSRVNMDTDALTVGWTWHIGDVKQREREDGYHAAVLAALTSRVPDPVPTPAVEPPPATEPPVEAPAPPHEEPKKPIGPSDYLPYAPGLILAIVAAILKEKH